VCRLAGLERPLQLRSVQQMRPMRATPLVLLKQMQQVQSMQQVHSVQQVQQVQQLPHKAAVSGCRLPGRSSAPVPGTAV
jgi:hypothetical protein